MVAGIMGIQEGMEDAETQWLGHIGVEDIDHAATTAQAKGARLLQAPSYVQGVGRMVILIDPWGAQAACMTPDYL